MTVFSLCFIHIHIIQLFSDFCCFLWVIVIHNSYLCSLIYNISFFSSKCFTIYLWFLLLGLWYVYLWFSSCLPSILENSHLLMLTFFPSTLSPLLHLHLHYARSLCIVPQVTEVLFVFISNIFFFMFSNLENFCWAIFRVTDAFFIVSNLLLNLSKGSLFQILYFSVWYPLAPFYCLYLLTKIPHLLHHIYSCFISYP